MCGIAGAFGVSNAAYTVSLMLKALQHRGQESAGIVAADRQNGFRQVRGFGLADEVFLNVDWDRDLPGGSAIGHVRYSTVSERHNRRCIQPFHCQERHGNLAIAHNGNLTNYDRLRESLTEKGATFLSRSDSGVFLHLLAQSRRNRTWERIGEAINRTKGASALLVMDDSGLYAAVDPFGFRPLFYACWGGGYLFASETSAFDIFPAESVRPVEPGTVVYAGHMIVPLLFRQFAKSDIRRQCSFCHVYFSRPDSMVFGQPSYAVRERLGQALAARHPVEVDLVVPVPDSSNVMALAYAQALGLPFAFALMRSHYMGRTFITPRQEARELGVRMKLNVVRAAVAGKRVAIIDDSIVRGTTSRKIAALLRAAGAREIHFRSASPPVISPCHWGIDTPERDQLFAAMTPEPDRAAALSVDSLGYLTVSDLLNSLEDSAGSQHCVSCFTGRHPTAGLPRPASLLPDLVPEG